MLCVLTAPLTRGSPFSLSLGLLAETQPIEVRLINNPLVAPNGSRESKSHISLTLNQKLEELTLRRRCVENRDRLKARPPETARL